jgi:hypothetical protein
LIPGIRNKLYSINDHTRSPVDVIEEFPPKIETDVHVRGSWGSDFILDCMDSNAEGELHSHMPMTAMRVR